MAENWVTALGNARSNPQERQLSSSSCMGERREGRTLPKTTLEDVKVVEMLVKEQKSNKQRTSR